MGVQLLPTHNPLELPTPRKMARRLVLFCVFSFSKTMTAVMRPV